MAAPAAVMPRREVVLVMTAFVTSRLLLVLASVISAHFLDQTRWVLAAR
jgi:hypothetical protein